MSIDRNYAELVAQAESATAGVKDPELKRVAFQKVLDDLLATPSGTPLLTTGSRRKPAKKKTTSAKKAKVKKKFGPITYIEEMIADDVFKNPKTLAQVKAELANRGHHVALTSLSGPLQRLTQRKKLRRQRSKVKGNKQTYAYSKA